MVEQMRAANLYHKQLIDKRLMTAGTLERLPEAYQEELTYDEVTECYKKWATNFFENELTAEQRRDHRYHLTYRGDGAVRLTRFQRSFIDNILRKNLASKHVGYAIWQLGLPNCLDNPPGSLLEDLFSHHFLLKSGAQEIASWLGRLGAELHRRTETAEYQEQKRLAGASYGCSGKTADDFKRKRQLVNLRMQRADAKKLCLQRDNGALKLDDLEPDAQQLIADYELNVLDRKIQAIKLPRRNFRA